MTYEDAFIPFVTRHVIAVGMAIGMFFGLIPLCGLKTLPAIGITRLLRGSIVGAAIGVTLHDIILPVVPLLLGWEYDVGYWLLSHPHELPPRLRLSHQSPAILVPLAHVLTVGFRCHSTRWWWRPGWRRDVLPHAYLRDDLWLGMGLAVTESKTDFHALRWPRIHLGTGEALAVGSPESFNVVSRPQFQRIPRWNAETLFSLVCCRWSRQFRYWADLRKA